MYPLKFKPIIKKCVWGSESWVLSGVAGEESVVANGMLRGNNLQELAEVYMGDLVGESVFESNGDEFPVLIKFIDARDKLSVQVHPNDELAQKRHFSRGKTEMWYIVSATADAAIYAGFRRPTTVQEYVNAVKNNTLAELLNRYDVRAGEAYFIPAGTVHAIGGGCVIAEIQQTSDITYRIYDWGRMGTDGNPRQLHTEEALEAINFSPTPNINITVNPAVGEAKMMVATPYFTTRQIALAGRMERDYSLVDSFVVLVCTEGGCTVQYDSGVMPLSAQEIIFVPADQDIIILNGEATVLEVSI